MRESSRRKFLRDCSIAGTAALVLPVFAGAESGRLKAAVIGHSGHGDYGHGLDVIFEGLPNVDVVVLADADEAGRQKAAARAKAARQYANYLEMLQKERPNLVSIAPRWTDEHLAMGVAALEAGAHVISEKPFAQTLAEADRLLALAKEKKRKIAVAHQMRLAPSIQYLKTAVERGAIGELLEIRAHGKQDARAGGEDMIVLGTHLFDLMRLFAGEPLWCSARILQSGKEVTIADARKATEGIGPVIGDDIEAQFAFANGVTGSFTSRGKARQIAGDWGLRLVGTKGVIRVLTGMVPILYTLKSGESSASGRTDEWRPVEGDPTANWSSEQRGSAQGNRRVVDDWLAAIREDRDPVCSGYNGMKAIEMAHGVFEAGLKQTRVRFPLANREHPLKRA